MTPRFLATTCLLVSTSSLAAAEPGAPKAYVLDHADRWTQTEAASRLLTEAGFQVEPLPLDRSPRELLESDLIFLASVSSEHPGYKDYMARHAKDLLEYAGEGRVLVQMAQADQTESVPPFLPTAMNARRGDRDLPKALVLSPRHPLLAGVEAPEGAIQLDATSTIWEGFVEQTGFEVLLAGDAFADLPALLEAASGKGRIVLAAMAFDKDAPRDPKAADAFQSARKKFAASFFANLRTHAAAVRSGKAPAPQVTPHPSRSLEIEPGGWTLAVLPDTQVYSMLYPGLFLAQTSWIVQNLERLNIRYVLQLGDIVNNNTSVQWRNARMAMSLLDGRVPYAISPGNHDYGPNGNSSTRDTLFHEYFPLDEIRKWPTFGGVREEGRLDNSFHLFEAGGRKWIIVALEWAPRDETVAWADEIMRRHPDRLGILITHAYMNNNDLRYDATDTKNPQLYNPHQYSTPGTMNDGQELWDKLVKHHDFVFVLNGHVLGDGAAYLESRNERGRVVHQMLSNYQMRTLGGEAYLRLLQFSADGKTVQVRTYSPLYDRFLLEPDQQLTLEIDR
jgi:hypothetical protein